jgi:hypothetical protein
MEKKFQRKNKYHRRVLTGYFLQISKVFFWVSKAPFEETKLVK